MRLIAKYIKTVILVLVIAIIIIYNLYFSNKANTIFYNKEGFESDLAASFCKKYEGNTAELDIACSNLTSKNCKSSSCCVYVNGNKCSAGGENGPTYKTDKQGNKILVNNYYYQNKCYGTGCSK